MGIWWMSLQDVKAAVWVNPKTLNDDVSNSTIVDPVVPSTDDETTPVVPASTDDSTTEPASTDDSTVEPVVPASTDDSTAPVVPASTDDSTVEPASTDASTDDAEDTPEE